MRLRRDKRLITYTQETAMRIFLKDFSSGFCLLKVEGNDSILPTLLSHRNITFVLHPPL